VVWRVAVAHGQDLRMAEHSAVSAARAAHTHGDLIFQHTLTLSAHQGPQPPGRTLPTKPDDVNAALNAVAAAGWELVTSGIIDHLGSTAVAMTYVWRRK
jgi:hypothetical protein